MSKKLPQEILRCPDCQRPELSVTADALVCAGCLKPYRRKGDRFVFVENTFQHMTDDFDKWKYFFKGHYRFYDAAKKVFSPVYMTRHLGRFLRDHVKGREQVVLNLGSGNRDLGPEISNVDLFPYDKVDLVCDAACLPLKDASADIVINVALLEHVEDPARVMREIWRVLKPGGTVYTFVPFMQGFHASPRDYFRWTSEGVRILHEGFEPLEIINEGGPTSALLWMLQEWLAMALSFGIRPLYRTLYLLLMLATFPIKYLDIILVRHPLAKHISSGFTYVGIKK